MSGRPERPVDRLLGLGGDQLARLGVAEAVLVQQPAARERPLPQLDVVRLPAGEVLARGPELARGDDPEVHLQPGRGQDRGLGLPAADHLADHGQPHERLAHRGRLARGHHDVHVGDGLAQPAEAAAVLGALDAGQRLERLHQLARDRHRLGDRPALVLAGLPHASSREQELLLQLLPQPVHGPHLPAFEGGPQVLEVAHAELAPEPEQRLGPEAGDLAELHEVRGVLPPELLELGDRPGLVELADLLRRARADAVDTRQLSLGEGRQVALVRGERVGGLLVGAHSEGVGRAFVEHRELPKLAEQSQERVASSGHFLKSTG